jgi:hypothetical protein
MSARNPIARPLAFFLPSHDADQPGLGDAAVHFDAPFGELVGDDLRGARLLERELRIGMDVAADVDQVGLEQAQHLQRVVFHRAPQCAVAGALDAQARIDCVVQQVDNEIDDDEEQRDQAQVGGHHRHVGDADGLDEEQPHAGPLEHRLGDDRERDDRAELQAGDRDDRHERVLQCVAEMHRAVGKAARAGELDVVGAQHFQHLGAHEALDQRHLEQAERDRRQDQRLQAGRREEPGAPPAERDRLAAAERGHPAEQHREHEDQQDADEERRQRNADQRYREQHLRKPGISSQCRIDAHRDSGNHCEQRGDERQLERRGQPLHDQLRHRLRLAQAQTEFAVQRVAEKLRVLHVERLIESQHLRDAYPVLRRRILSQHEEHRVADVTKQRERDQADGQHHQDGLREAAQDER